MGKSEVKAHKRILRGTTLYDVYKSRLSEQKKYKWYQNKFREALNRKPRNRFEVWYYARALQIAGIKATREKYAKTSHKKAA